MNEKNPTIEVNDRLVAGEEISILAHERGQWRLHLNSGEVLSVVEDRKDEVLEFMRSHNLRIAGDISHASDYLS